MNPNSHIPYLQAQLAFAWHNRLVLDRRLSADSCRFTDAQWSDDTRKARESYWIRRLNTMQPHGINKGD